MDHQATLSTEEQRVAHRQRVHDALVRAGVCTRNRAPLTSARPLSDDQRNALAQQVARGRPLSDYICEEREAH